MQNFKEQVKENVSIPVIGNGDITTKELAKKMLEETGCDAIMIGRGVLGNPWLIRDTVALLDGKKYFKEVTPVERIDMCIKHLKLLSELKNEKVAVLEIRNHIAWYLKGVEGSNQLKNNIYQMTSLCDILHMLEVFRRNFV